MAGFECSAGCPNSPVAECIGAVSDTPTSPSLRRRAACRTPGFFRSQFECCENRDLYHARRRWFVEKGRLGQAGEEANAENLGRFAMEGSLAHRRSEWAPQGCRSYRAVYQREREWFAAHRRQEPRMADLATPDDVAMKKVPYDTPGLAAWSELARSCSIMVLTLSCWFASNAFLDEISLDYDLHDLQGPFLTASVNIGFMVTATAAAMLQLPDRLPRKFLVLAGALTCASMSAVFVVRQPFGSLIVLRLCTGAGISFIYPILVKHVVTWFPKASRGFALSILIGSFTLAIAIPSLLRAVMPSIPWRLVNLTTAGFALFGGILAMGMKDGPYAQHASAFSAKAVLRVLRNRNWQLATLSYVGHNLELFGGWSSLGLFLGDCFEMHGSQQEKSGSSTLISFVTFGVIATGFFGAVAGGYLADRVGRRPVIAASHLTSGLILALLPSLSLVAPSWVMVGAAGIWGAVSIADSAQYSAVISEVFMDTDGGLIGTAVALSLAFGFSSTAVGIFAVPFLRESVGWAGAFPCLALGPALGFLAIFGVRTQQSAPTTPVPPKAMVAGWGRCRTACGAMLCAPFQTRRSDTGCC